MQRYWQTVRKAKGPIADRLKPILWWRAAIFLTFHLYVI